MGFVSLAAFSAGLSALFSLDAGLSPSLRLLRPLAVVRRVEARAFEVHRDREEDLLHRPSPTDDTDLGRRIAHPLEDLEGMPVRATILVDRHGTTKARCLIGNSRGPDDGHDTAPDRHPHASHRLLACTTRDCVARLGRDRPRTARQFPIKHPVVSPAATTRSGPGPVRAHPRGARDSTARSRMQPVRADARAGVGRGGGGSSRRVPPTPRPGFRGRMSVGLPDAFPLPRR